jgi:hypothetical protein
MIKTSKQNLPTLIKCSGTSSTQPLHCTRIHEDILSHCRQQRLIKVHIYQCDNALDFHSLNHIHVEVEDAGSLFMYAMLK